MSIEKLNKVNHEISKLETERETIKEQMFFETNDWFELLKLPYDSSSSRTPEYMKFHRVFKKQFPKLLKEKFDIDQVIISKPNHFDAHGFFSLKNGNIWYFSVGDLRWDKTFMIRTATSFEDYTGGSNAYCSTDNYEAFIRDLVSIVK